MRETDFLIIAHSAALTNAMFMRPHSAVIEILTLSWFQPFYVLPLDAYNVAYYILSQTSLERSNHCGLFLERCMTEPEILQQINSATLKKLRKDFYKTQLVDNL